MEASIDFQNTAETTIIYMSMIETFLLPSPDCHLPIFFKMFQQKQRYSRPLHLRLPARPHHEVGWQRLRCAAAYHDLAETNPDAGPTGEGSCQCTDSGCFIRLDRVLDCDNRHFCSPRNSQRNFKNHSSGQ